MGVELNEIRKNFTDNAKQLLYDEVKGYCPICGKKLMHKKNGKIYKNFEVAHIYPLNPNPNQTELLKNEERLSKVNDLDNLLATCTDCHHKFDNPRTVGEYRQWIAIKKRLINDNKAKNIYCNYNLEEEIYDVIKLIIDTDLYEKSAQLGLESLKVDEKTNETCSYALKKSLKNNIVDYFNYIKKVFIEIDKTSPYKFETIATQIKAFYLSCMQINTNQEWIYQEIVEWLYKKTNSRSKAACEVIVAFFVQNCEVFS